MKYNHESQKHRQMLAGEIVSKLTACGFTQVSEAGTKELLFERPVVGVKNMRVRVYTSVDQVGARPAEVRLVGSDAIRVVTLYTAGRDGKDRPLAKANMRVFRTGDLAAITDRMHERMQECYRVGLSNPCTCNQCGAPTFNSKEKRKKDRRTGKMVVVKKSRVVCAELCWLK